MTYKVKLVSFPPRCLAEEFIYGWHIQMRTEFSPQPNYSCSSKILNCVSIFYVEMGVI